MKKSKQEEAQRIAAPTFQLKFAELEKFEHLVYSRQHDAAIGELFEVLGRIRSGGLFEGHSIDDGLLSMLCTRLAAGITSLFADPHFVLSEEGHARFALEHPIVELVYRVSGFHAYDFMMGLVSHSPTELNVTKLRFDSPMALAKMTLFLGLGSHIDVQWNELFTKAPRIMMPVWASMLSHLAVLSPRAHERREELYQHVADFVGLKEFPVQAFGPMSDAYMYSSYRTVARPHDVKKTMVRIFREAIQQQCTSALPTEAAISTRRQMTLTRAAHGSKPRLLVCIEWYNSFHAMHRCYAPLILQLRERFHLIAAVRENELDPPARAHFDEVIEFSHNQFVFEELIQKISALKPDIIYYPSIGMNLHWTVMSTLRLAPIQVMTLGHPATSGSDMIDYAIVSEGAVGDPSLMTERVVTLPRKAMFHFIRRPDTYPPPVTERDPSGALHIAVPAMALKLNVPFMDSLKRIEQRTQRKIVFRFFPNTIGLTHLYLAQQIKRRWFPDAIVHPRVGYAKYLEWLETCDIHLSTFPFGGTNGVIDAFMIGLPVVAREGPEPMERFESLVLRANGLGELVATSTEEFESIAVKLIEDDAYRADAAARVKAIDLEAEFFGPREPEIEGAFGRAMWHLFNTHEAIVASKLREIALK